MVASNQSVEDAGPEQQILGVECHKRFSPVGIAVGVPLVDEEKRLTHRAGVTDFH